MASYAKGLVGLLKNAQAKKKGDDDGDRRRREQEQKEREQQKRKQDEQKRQQQAAASASAAYEAQLRAAAASYEQNLAARQAQHAQEIQSREAQLSSARNELTTVKADRDVAKAKAQEWGKKREVEDRVNADDQLYRIRSGGVSSGGPASGQPGLARGVTAYSDSSGGSGRPENTFAAEGRRQSRELESGSRPQGPRPRARPGQSFYDQSSG
jgi:membrane protein involved in colicin uptake